MGNVKCNAYHNVKCNVKFNTKFHVNHNIHCVLRHNISNSSALFAKQPHMPHTKKKDLRHLPSVLLSAMKR